MTRTQSLGSTMFLLLAALALAACGDDGSPATGTPDAGTPDAGTNPLVQARPYMLNVPSSYDKSKPTPLVLLLHGYSANPYVQVRIFGLLDGSEKHGYLVAYPDGMTDSSGKQFWNATDGCCNIDNSPVDDVAYLSAVIDDVEARYNIDPKRVYVMGHSNGGYMAHRLACDIGGRIAAIVSLAGMTWLDPSKCPAAAPVNVLQVHGDADDTVLYTGSSRYPSAPVTVATWAAKNHCSGALADGGAPIDLVSDLVGAETTLQSYAGCPAAGAVDFWTIHGGGHIPMLVPSDWEEVMWAWLVAHPKP